MFAYFLFSMLLTAPFPRCGDVHVMEIKLDHEIRRWFQKNAFLLLVERRWHPNIDYACNQNDCCDFECPQLLVVYSSIVQNLLLNKVFSLHFNMQFECFCFDLAHSLLLTLANCNKQSTEECVSMKANNNHFGGKKCAILDFYESFGHNSLFSVHSFFCINSFNYIVSFEKHNGQWVM